MAIRAESYHDRPARHVHNTACNPHRIVRGEKSSCAGHVLGQRVIVERIREPQDETIDVLFALTSLQTFDVLAGAKRRPAEVAPIVLRVARAILELPI